MTSKLQHATSPEAEFRNVLKNALAGIFTIEAWHRWHLRLGIPPIPPLGGSRTVK
jgi:hypothetical protein